MAGNMKLQILSRLLITAVLIFLILPIVIVFVASLTSTLYPAFPPPSLSLRWWVKAWGLNWLWSSLKTSTLLGLTATFTSGIFGLLAAHILTRRPFRGKGALETIFLGPLFVPAVVIGFALLAGFSRSQLRHPFLNLFAGHLLVTLPYMVRTIWASMAGLDPALEEAAQSLGASPLMTFRKITLPLVKPGLAAGFLLGFTYSINDVALSVFLVGPGVSTLSIDMLSYIIYSADPALAAISSMLVIASLGLFLLIEQTVGLGVFARVN